MCYLCVVSVDTLFRSSLCHSSRIAPNEKGTLGPPAPKRRAVSIVGDMVRSEEHTSELQSR